MPTYSLKVSEEHNNLRVDVFLTKSLTQAPSRSFIKKLIEAQEVLVNNRKVTAHQKVLAGDEVKVNFVLPAEENIAAENIPLDILYDDEDLLIVNKPVGMTAHPAKGCYTGTLVNALLFHYKSLSDVSSMLRAGIVHRLDRETSGLMVVAKTNIAHARLARQFERHKVKKRYVALVNGIVEFDEGLIEASLGRHPVHRDKKSVDGKNAKEAKTYYQVLKRGKDKTLIALFPQTGRTHQLRVHMKHLGHWILGDDKYGKKDSFPRLALHAQSLGFTHPTKGYYLEFSSVPPFGITEKP